MQQRPTGRTEIHVKPDLRQREQESDQGEREQSDNSSNRTDNFAPNWAMVRRNTHQCDDAPAFVIDGLGNEAPGRAFLGLPFHPPRRTERASKKARMDAAAATGTMSTRRTQAECSTGTEHDECSRDRQKRRGNHQVWRAQRQQEDRVGRSFRSHWTMRSDDMMSH